MCGPSILLYAPSAPLQPPADKFVVVTAAVFFCCAYLVLFGGLFYKIGYLIYIKFAVVKKHLKEEGERLFI
jgi:hypothetical protein